MCGRYKLSFNPERLQEFFRTENVPEYIPREHATPQQLLPIVVRRPHASHGLESYRAGSALWGLCREQNLDLKNAPIINAPIINARAETVHQKPRFMRLWAAARRCLIPADAFYEWQTVMRTQDSKPGPQKIGYKISSNYCSAFGMAGLWEKNGDVVSFTILTRAASPALQPIHARMPVMFASEQGLEWLRADIERAHSMINDTSMQDDFEITPMEKTWDSNTQQRLLL